ncbi:MAG: right-handed parallel beta-helix repeat-containing protein [Candidatus Thermoplasmatota archaeon]|nr:right-handed parallel beta-helix repeat-containing protein [Candidatus Thermoplasmatota archaeon]
MIFCILLCIVSVAIITPVQSFQEHASQCSSLMLSQSSVIIIPDDYPTIQEGIDNADSGDTIFVRSGVYKESIVISTENLSLVGENKLDTVIDINNSSSDAVGIKAEGVTLQGFTITHARSNDALIWNQSGIAIFTSNVTVRDTIISDNRLGILSYTTAYNLTICDNMFFYDGFFPGCYLQNIDGHYQGTENIPLACLTLNVSNNTINGKPLYYLQNIHDSIIEDDIGQVVLINCTNITVRNVAFLKNDFSVLLYYCNNCIVENITILDSDGELILFFSENTTIQYNRINESMVGICFDLGAKNNIARYNELYDCREGISIITLCSGNKVYGNILYQNDYGVRISSYTKNAPAHDNEIYENEVLNNKYGIVLSTSFRDPLCYTYNNTIFNNTIKKNFIGIELYSTEGNTITHNIFQKNVLSAFFVNCSQNNWNNNYWNRPRILPKPIIGVKLVGSLPIPTVNFDWHPARFIDH